MKDRLTTNKSVSEMGMFELAHNSCYTKDGVARYRDFEQDIDARELTRMLLEEHTEDNITFVDDADFDEWMVDYLQNGMDSLEGLIALFYRNLWAMADLRERLKEYEDLEEHGLLLRLPCKVGDTVYYIYQFNDTMEIVVLDDEVDFINIKENCTVVRTVAHDCLDVEDFGKTVFLTREEAEKALEKMKGKTE